MCCSAQISDHRIISEAFTKRDPGVSLKQDECEVSFSREVERNQSNKGRKRYSPEQQKAEKLQKYVKVPRLTADEGNMQKKTSIPEDIKKAVEAFEKNEVLRIAHFVLTEDHINYIVKQTKKKTKWKKLSLRCCKIGDECLARLVKMPSKKIESLNFSGNEEIDTLKVKRLIMKHKSEKLNLSECAMDSKKLGKLGTPKIRTMKMDCTPITDDEMVNEIANILCKSQLTKLSLVDCDLRSERMKTLSAKLDGLQIDLRNLILKYNNLGATGFFALANLVNLTQNMDLLDVSDCGLCDAGLKKFLMKVEREIKKLDISANEKISSVGFKHLAKVIDKCKITDLYLSELSITKDHILNLQESSPTEMRNLDLSENTEMDLMEVGKLAAKWKLKSLDLSECKLTAEKLRKLKEGLAEHKLESVRLLEPLEKPNSEKLSALTELCSSITKALYLNLNKINQEELEDMRKSHPKVSISDPE